MKDVTKEINLEIEKEIEEYAKDLEHIITRIGALAFSGNEKAILELWKAGVNSAKLMDVATHQEKPKGIILKLAKKQMEWPFVISAIGEDNKGKTSANPDKLREWLGLGKGTGLRLEGKRKFRKYGQKTETGIARWAIAEIDRDLKKYAGWSDGEISASSYSTWKRRRDLKPDKKSVENRKSLLKYVHSIRAITDRTDDNQWFKAAELLVMVYSEGNPETPGLWPDSVYKRSKGRGTAFNTITQKIQDGLEKVLDRPSP